MTSVYKIQFIIDILLLQNTSRWCIFGSWPRPGPSVMGRPLAVSRVVNKVRDVTWRQTNGPNKTENFVRNI